MHNVANCKPGHCFLFCFFLVCLIHPLLKFTYFQTYTWYSEHINLSHWQFCLCEVHSTYMDAARKYYTTILRALKPHLPADLEGNLFAMFLDRKKTVVLGATSAVTLNTNLKKRGGGGFETCQGKMGLFCLEFMAHKKSNVGNMVTCL